MLFLHSRSFYHHSVSAGKKGGFYKIPCPTTLVQLFESRISISGKLMMELACELLRSDRVSLTTVEFPLRAFYLPRGSRLTKSRMHVMVQYGRVECPPLRAVHSWSRPPLDRLRDAAAANSNINLIM
ncbi:hypothetical protein BDQ94DRAFT_164454 [Aspergillus welwitschiae]|uniref:Uncharacterized protein n=1 Tax=Aspergillus welwitschiae TaxID=1341132 RepID=A0A3F3PHR8_9EURO|nr:hypothetical protein BDQ94DRAFT_164454 [Aspergillus welwitschiae]RDH26469.1 hypothetical protein BDQ94DRAFT_164454 [Aspergillus welwitschiae]